jgi:hypothetical protein
MVEAEAEVNPQRPTSANVAKILGIDESRVSTRHKEQQSTPVGKVIWTATYRISGEEDCSITITLYPNDRIKTAIFEEMGMERFGFQKIPRDDGDMIYHLLGDIDDQGAHYTTTLINHENDWDMTLRFSRKRGVDESKLPLAIAKDGINLIGEFETVLRKPKAQQDGAVQPATASESKSEGEEKPQSESEVRPQ